MEDQVAIHTVDDLIQGQFLAPELDEMIELQKFAEKNKFKAKIVWRNVFIFIALHVGATIGLYQLFFLAKWQTFLWTFACYIMSGLGITVGAHRLWSHRSYKAKIPFESLLLIFNTMAFQNHVIEWARDHRCHHKWTDTDADPHNTHRGFFFSHMGWLMMKKHPKIREMGAKLDMSDLENNPLLAFQKKHFMLLALLFAVLIPTVIPVYFWKEKAYVAFYCAVIFRYTMTLHFTWFINSIAHMFGYRPYDVNISPTENLLTSITALGEGGHNYHHTFPQDYRASEMSYMVNFSKLVIDSFAKIGWAYDLTTVDDATIQRQMDRQVQVKKMKGL